MAQVASHPLTVSDVIDQRPMGRFQIGKDSPDRPVNLVFGAGYQFAVTANPVIQNNVVATVRVTF